ncbi:hypothetical protein NUM3379_26990 [Kineococcus sp. NUM-3379]
MTGTADVGGSRVAGDGAEAAGGGPAGTCVTGSAVAMPDAAAR